MKHLSSLMAALLLISSASFGQNLKFGHIDIEYLVALMPDRDSAQVKLSIYAQSLQQTLEDIQTELQTKYATYQRQQATWTAAVQETKQRELQELDARLAEYQQSASNEYQEMYNVLFAPVYQKAQATVDQIGKSKGLVYIFNTSTRPLLYIDSTLSEDILPAARVALGIPADKVPVQLQQPEVAQ